MRLLLDTHAFLWFVMGDERLSSVARAAIEDESNDRYLSAASAWEISIKLGLGKLQLTIPLMDFMTVQLSRNRIAMLSIDVSHICLVPELPLHHRDPFDRMLIAQAMVEQMTLVSKDSFVPAYPVQHLW